MKRILCGYLEKHWKGILFYLMSAGIFCFVFYLYGISPDAAIYAFTLSLVPGLLLISYDFYQYFLKCRMLSQMKANPLHAQAMFKQSDDLAEREYQTIIQMLWDEKMEAVSAARIGKQEMLDYYSMWAHQIKIPISAMRLLLQTMENEEADDLAMFGMKMIKPLKMELFKTEQYVEMVLSYLRMEDMSSDLVLQWYPVSGIVKQVIRKYSQMFILKKIKLVFTESDNMVLTDEKWLSFVLEQVLSNALKYTKAGEITIYMQQEHTLFIEDTGIGIQAEDLPRIFEKGFTGYNGRKDKKSTGIGLYLCRQVFSKLNHRIEITSEVGVGTRVMLTLGRTNLTNM